MLACGALDSPIGTQGERHGFAGESITPLLYLFIVPFPDNSFTSLSYKAVHCCCGYHPFQAWDVPSALVSFQYSKDVNNAKDYVQRLRSEVANLKFISRLL
jgi:hypothetical protein